MLPPRWTRVWCRLAEHHVQAVYEIIAKTAVRAFLLVLFVAFAFGLFTGRTAPRPTDRRTVELGRRPPTAASAAFERRRPAPYDVRQAGAGTGCRRGCRGGGLRPRHGHVPQRLVRDPPACPLRVPGVEYVFHEHGRLLGAEQAAGHRAGQELVGGHLQVPHGQQYRVVEHRAPIGHGQFQVLLFALVRAPPFQRREQHLRTPDGSHGG